MANFVFNLEGIVTENSYDLEDLECMYANSDECRELPDELREWYLGADFSEVWKRQSTEKYGCILDGFLTVATDYIGISEGEQFCCDNGYDDLQDAIYKALECEYGKAPGSDVPVAA